MRCGRGFAKTFTGAIHTAIYVLTYSNVEFGVVARTKRDLKKINFDDNLLKLIPKDCIESFDKQDMILTLINGSVLQGFTGQKPDGIRGSNLNGYWVDELPAYQYPEDVMHMLTMALRRKKGFNPPPRLAMITTTPRGTALIKKLCTDKDTFETIGTPYDNKENLTDDYFRDIEKEYADTRLGRQEIWAEILEDIGTLWTFEVIDKNRIIPDPQEDPPVVLPRFNDVVVAMDPASTAKINSDETGIVVVARAGDEYYVLEDLSMRGSPYECAVVAINAYNRHKAKFLLGEVNGVGDYFETSIRATAGGDKVRLKTVVSQDSKKQRAQTPANKYEQGKVHHVGDPAPLAKLEDQMCNFTGDPREKSPDRMDALVHGLDLLIKLSQQKKTVGDWI